MAAILSRPQGVKEDPGISSVQYYLCFHMLGKYFSINKCADPSVLTPAETHLPWRTTGIHFTNDIPL